MDRVGIDDDFFDGLVRRYLAYYMGHLAGMEEFESLVRTATALFI